MSPALRVRLPLLITLVSAVGLLVYGPIAQLLDYHAFADRRVLFGVLNGADVLSNAGFAIVGWSGLRRVWAARQDGALGPAWPGYALFVLSVVLTSIGSTFYHLAPDNDPIMRYTRRRGSSAATR